jgi:hypothetical protein
MCKRTINPSLVELDKEPCCDSAFRP